MEVIFAILVRFLVIHCVDHHASTAPAMPRLFLHRTSTLSILPPFPSFPSLPPLPPLAPLYLSQAIILDIRLHILHKLLKSLPLPLLRLLLDEGHCFLVLSLLRQLLLADEMLGLRAAFFEK